MSADTKLIAAFFKEETYNIEINVSKSEGGLIDWCRTHSGIQGKDWEVIRLSDEVLLGVFFDKNMSVLFGLTWG